MRLPLMPVSVRENLDALTAHWVGWTFPPAARARADSNWRPDSPDAYCARCGDSVGPGEATDAGCATCRPGAELEGGLGDGVVRLGAYLNPLRAWILRIKFERWSEMAQHLGRLLAEQIEVVRDQRTEVRDQKSEVGDQKSEVRDQVRDQKSEVGDQKSEVGDLKSDTTSALTSDLRLLTSLTSSIDFARTIVIPMPMPWPRRLYRGVDHARIIAAALAHELNVPLANVLARDNVSPQVALTPSERKRAGARGLRVRRRLLSRRWPLDGLHIILVDDVRTTGASLKAGVRLLRALKPERIVCAVLAVSDSKSRRIRHLGLRHEDQHSV